MLLQAAGFCRLRTRALIPDGHCCPRCLIGRLKPIFTARIAPHRLFASVWIAQKPLQGLSVVRKKKDPRAACGVPHPIGWFFTAGRVRPDFLGGYLSSG
jgi:hypothetical protein